MAAVVLPTSPAEDQNQASKITCWTSDHKALYQLVHPLFDGGKTLPFSILPPSPPNNWRAEVFPVEPPDWPRQRGMRKTSLRDLTRHCAAAWWQFNGIFWPKNGPQYWPKNKSVIWKGHIFSIIFLPNGVPKTIWFSANKQQLIIFNHEVVSWF